MSALSTMLGLVLVIQLGLVRTGVAQAPGAPTGASPSVETLLNEDGTLNLETGFRGSLDVSGWHMVEGEGGAPRFVRAAASVPGDENWDDQFKLAGTNGQVNAVAVDGSGNLYVGGGFTTAGGVSANRIAQWNVATSTWSALGDGVNHLVHALAFDGSGNLYAAGRFTTAGGGSANRIAQWNVTTSTWSNLGSGMDNEVYALAYYGGVLYAGGQFAMAGGVSASYVAKWDGSSWSAFSSSTGGPVLALVFDGSSTLYAGGRFSVSFGGVANHVAKWDGSTWSALGTGVNGWVNALAYYGGVLYAGGEFTTAGGGSASHIAQWHVATSTWSNLGSGVNNFVNALAVDGSGNLYVGGDFATAGAVTVNRIAKWDGSNWFALDSGMNNTVRALAVDGSSALYAGGAFTTAGGVSAYFVAKWSGTAWSALGTGSGMNNTVRALAVDGSGNLYVGGSFTTAGGVSASRIAKWNGTAWSALSTGMNGQVNALAYYGGVLYAGGSFMMAGAVTVNRIAKWNGTAWSNLDTGVSSTVNALAVDGSGNLYAGGSFMMAGAVTVNRIAQWNGTAWSNLDTGVSSTVNALAVDGSGNLYAGGSFTMAGAVTVNRIAKWDGMAWSPLSTGMNGQVNALAVDGSGNLYAGGFFTMAGGGSASSIAKWNGTAWSPLSAGMDDTVRALAVDGSGNLYAGGDFTTAGGGSAIRIAKWNGTAWSPLGSGMNSTVYGLAVDGSGNLYAGGDFTTAGAKPSNNIARWTIVPASVTLSRTLLGQGGLANDQGWRMLSAPITGATRADLADDVNFAASPQDMLYAWSGSAWSPLASANSPLPSGKGFIVYLFDNTLDSVDPDKTIDLTGTAPLGNVAVSGLAQADQWHLLGNPYATAFDLSSLDLGTGGFQTTVHLWDPEEGTYLLRSQDTGTDDVLGAWQGFFAERSMPDEGSTSLTFSGAGQRSGDGLFTGKRQATGQTARQARISFRLVAEDEQGQETARDEALGLVFDDEATDGWDVHDAGKLRPLAPAYATLAFLGNRAGEPVAKARESRPYALAGPVEVGLALQARAVGERFRLEWPLWEGVPEAWRLTLVDLETGTRTDLREQPAYRFTHRVEAGKTDEQAEGPVAAPAAVQALEPGRPRLLLELAPGAPVAAEAEQLPEGFLLTGPYPNPFNPRAELALRLDQPRAVIVALYDVLGRRVALLHEGLLAAGSAHRFTIEGSHLPSGLYLVRITGARFSTSRTVTLLK